MPDECITAELLLDVLERTVHARRSEWLFFRELRIGIGHRNRGGQRLDAFALNCLPHTGMKRVCYEIKVSRADFLCERKQPLKRRAGMRFSNEFLFVTPPGLIHPEELPLDCGLIEIGHAQTEEDRQLVRSFPGEFYFSEEDSWFCMVSVPALWRETPGPTWQFAAAMLRNQARTYSEKLGPQPKQQRLDLQATTGLEAYNSINFAQDRSFSPERLD